MPRPFYRSQVLGCVIVCTFAAFTGSTVAQDALATPPVEQPAGVPAGINDAFVDPELNVDEWVARFEVESREVFQARHEIIERMGLQPGDRVADIGAGTGLFTPLIGGQVGKDGWVFAVDIAPRFVEHIVEQLPKWPQARVTPVLCTAESVCLPPGSIDAAFICDVYHHFEYPKQTLASLHLALKPQGRIIIVDFERVPGVSREWVLDHVRAGKETVIDEMREAGFELVGERTIAALQENYYLEFGRVGTSAE